MAPALTGPPTPVPEISAGLHFPCLDAYRALGMTMVLLIHAAFATGYDKHSWLGPYIARFDLALPMFFIISGFLLYLPYVKELLRDRRVDTRDYYRRRALRIFPGYWAALLGITVIFSLQVDGIRQIVANVFLLPAFGSTEGYLIFPAWSIGIELTFYLVLPLYAVGLRRLLAGRDSSTRVRGMLTGALALYVLGELIRLAVVVADPSWAGRSLLWFPLYIEFFAIGMAVAVYVVTAPTTADLPRPLAWLARHPGVCWATALAVFLAVAQLTPPETPFGLSSREYLPRQFGYGLFSLLCLLPGIFGDQREGRIRGFLQLRPLVYLGGISYSFYLWHHVLVDQAKQWTVSDLDQRELIGGLAPFTGNFWLISLIAWVCSALVASVLFRFVELPFLKLKDRPLRDFWKRQPGKRMIRHG
jgi:peptidoglycan/LPS O-acetylase OafA/YrhL